MMIAIKEFIKKELSGWTKCEQIIIPLVLIGVVILSICAKDSKIVTIYSIFGILSTIFAGKGKISCYIFGIVAVSCYSYISYKNAFWGMCLLQILYYLPMEFIGIFAWKNHLKKESQEIIKTTLSNKERCIISIVAIIAIIILGFILRHHNGQLPFLDALCTILPIIAFYLTVKRCFEQWIVWTVVNATCAMMWLIIFLSGEDVLATFLAWFVYLSFGIYFSTQWYKELKQNKTGKELLQ